MVNLGESSLNGEMYMWNAKENAEHRYRSEEYVFHRDAMLVEVSLLDTGLVLQRANVLQYTLERTTWRDQDGHLWLYDILVQILVKLNMVRKACARKWHYFKFWSMWKNLT